MSDANDHHNDFLRQMDTDEWVERYLEEEYGLNFFGGTDVDDGFENGVYSLRLVEEPLSDDDSWKLQPLVSVASDNNHDYNQVNNSLRTHNTDAIQMNFSEDHISPEIRSTVTATPQRSEHSSLTCNGLVDCGGSETFRTSDGVSNSFKKAFFHTHGGTDHHDNQVDGVFRSIATTKFGQNITSNLVTPSSSMHSSRTTGSTGTTGSDASEASRTTLNSLVDHSNNGSSVHAPFVFGSNFVVLGDKNPHRLPGVTSEYKKCKGEEYDRRTKITIDDLYKRFYPALIAYLQKEGKCLDAESIDDVKFMKKLEGSSDLTILEPDQRDEAVMKDIKHNSPNRKKSVTVKSFSAVISDAKETLDSRKSEIDLNVYEVCRSMLENMESRGQLDELTEGTFKKMIEKIWIWFIKPNVKETRKSPSLLAKDHDTEPGDQNCDDDEKSAKKRKENHDGPPPLSGSGMNGGAKGGNSTNAAARQNALLDEVDVCSDWEVVSSCSSSSGWESDESVKDDRFHFPDHDDSDDDSDDDNDDENGGVGTRKTTTTTTTTFADDRIPRSIHIHSESLSDMQDCPTNEQGLQTAIENGDLVAVNRYFETTATCENESTVGHVDHSQVERVDYLHLSALHGHLHLVKYFLIYRKVNARNKDIKGKTALHYAARGGHLRILKFLILKGGADIEAQDRVGRTPLHEACIAGNLKIVLALLAQKVQVDLRNDHGWTGLFFACQEGHLHVAKALVEIGRADVNALSDFRTTALHKAIRQEKMNCVRFLLEECDAKVVENKNGWKGLHIASGNGSVEMVTYLITHAFAGVEDKTKFGMTALHIASLNGRHELVTSLTQELGANVEATSSDGFTPLLHACSAGHLKICEYLLHECGASPKVVDSMGRTALHISVLEEHEEIVKVLINHGEVDVNAVDNDGHTAIALARLNNHENIEQYLASYIGTQETATLASYSGKNRTVTFRDVKSLAGSSGGTPVTNSLTNDTDTITDSSSLDGDQKRIVNTTASPMKSNGTTKNMLSRYVPRLWKFSKG